jgi:hypothetical protein
MTKAQSLPKILDVRRLGFLVAGSLLLWLAVVYPARQLGGDEAVFLSAVALALCLVPAAATMAWALRAGTSPESQLLMILGGTGVRMGIVLGGGLLLTRLFPDYFPAAFWIWLVVFYLFTLALEMTLLVRGSKPSEPKG